MLINALQFALTFVHDVDLLFDCDTLFVKVCSQLRIRCLIFFVFCYRFFIFDELSVLVFLRFSRAIEQTHEVVDGSLLFV